MKTFGDDNFLLSNSTAEKLFHDYAAGMPILDYHNHLPPEQIASNTRFENLTQIWLYGDHYKWRAMRANGVDEKFITGRSSDYEKFEKWAATVPYTARNPLFHWTHLELRNPFGIREQLDPGSARSIYRSASGQLKSKWPVHELLRHFNVKILCTTDDPADDLRFHRQLQDAGFPVKVFPTFRPDKAMAIESPGFSRYIDVLGAAAGMTVNTWNDFLEAIRQRHDHFARHGCRLSDHGLETFYAADFTGSEVEAIFAKARTGKAVNGEEVAKFKSACLLEFARLDASRNWTQQFHIGAIRNNSTRLGKLLGSDAGADSIGDLPIARSMSRFLDTLDRDRQLTRTIIYNLNPADNEVTASMIGNFNDGDTIGKMQYGAAWWFLDQRHGIEDQLNVISNFGLLSRFVGMLTDSRSFLSFSRHEYFRRILCNLVAKDVESGELPADINWLGSMIQDICYRNAERYFGFDQ